jgi:S-adenosylmethionine decarboxylase
MEFTSNNANNRIDNEINAKLSLNIDKNVNDIDSDEDPESSITSHSSVASLDSLLPSNGEHYIPDFEGPEKNMEVVFKPNIGAPDGLRTLTRKQLDNLCTKAKCTILSSISNSYMDAYVLSESSLFVYKHRYVMKTCGTTTLLRCLKTLLDYADVIGLELDWVGYSRKNLLFPKQQLWPHSNFGEEITYINQHEVLQDRLRGAGYILGPITGDHWFVYVADHSKIKSLSIPTTPSVSQPPSPTSTAISSTDAPCDERTINMMMFDMSSEIADIFFLKNSANGKDMTQKSGINTLCVGATIDEAAFTPCGYSMNAILHDSYFTIHITPEASCSYVSFETNTCLRDYSSMVRNVLDVFKPKRFVITLFGDEAAIAGIPELPTDTKQILVPSFGTFTRTSVSSTKCEDLHCMMGCFALDDKKVSSSPVSNALSARRTRGLSFDVV